MPSRRITRRPRSTWERGLRAGRRFALSLLHFCRWRARFHRFGWGSRLSAPDLLTHPRSIEIGRRVEIRKGARMEAVHPSGQDGPAISIGDHTTIHFYSHIGAALRIEIGRNVLIAGHVFITDHDHELVGPGRTRRGTALLAETTRIEDDCWLGEGCKILKGVHLGRGCVVGANAVVTRSFDAYTVIAGVPGRAVRRFDEEEGSWVSAVDREA